MIFLINLLIICVALFPKINIVSVGTSSAGIRIEDFLLALICALMFIFSKYNKKSKKIDENFLLVKKIFYLYFFASIISTVYGIAKGYVSPIVSVLFVVRKLEYFLMLYIGYYYGMKSTKINMNFLNFTVIFHFVMCVLQQVGLIGSFNRGEMLTTLTQGRVSSTFNGAYELSAFLLLLLPYYLKKLIEPSKEKMKSIVYICLITFCIVLSMSRTSLIIEIAIIGLMLYKYDVLKNRKIVQSVFVISLMLILPLFIAIPKIDFSRFENLNLKKTIYIFQYTWKYKNFNKYILTGSWYGNSIYTLNQFDAMGYDGSLYQRVSHWMQLIDGWTTSPLIGVGVSVSGNSADGNYIKILVETGIIGLILWCILLKKIYMFLNKEKNWLLFSYISVLLGSIFIDLFDSSKVIMTLWLLIGIYFRRSFDKDEENIEKYCNNK